MDGNIVKQGDFFMLRGKKITREQVLLCVIGFFVGRAVCFHMNPLAAAFFTAAHALSLSSVLLACVVLLGIASTGSASGVVSFLLFVFLFFVVSQVFARQKQTGTFRLCLMAGMLICNCSGQRVPHYRQLQHLNYIH